MTSPLDQVIAQLRAAIEELNTAAITAIRAQADAQQAQAHYREAGRGSTHPAIKGAEIESTTAAEKAGKVGRLLAETSAHLTAYVNIIAPGTIQPGHSTATAMPTGEELMNESVRRSEARAGIAGFLSKMTRNIEDVQDAGKSATQVAQTSYNIMRDPAGPAGSKSAGTTTPTVAPTVPAARIEPADAVGHLVAVGLFAAIAVHKTGQLIQRELARLRSHEDEQRNQRPHPRDGST